MKKLESFKNEICEAYKNGSTLKDLSKKFDVSQPTVSNFLKSNGVTVRSKGRKKKEKKPVTYDSVAGSNFALSSNI